MKKRIVSSILALAVFVSSAAAGGTPAFAAGAESAANAGSEEVSEVNGEEESSASSVSTSEIDYSSAEEEEGGEADEAVSLENESSSELQYVFENTTEDGTYIFVSVGEETDALSDAVLTVNADGGEASLSGDVIANVAAFFYAGEYSLVSLTGKINGQEQSFDLRAIDAQEGIEPDLSGYEVKADSESGEESGAREATDEEYEAYIAQADLYDASSIEDAIDACMSDSAANDFSVMSVDDYSDDIDTYTYSDEPYIVVVDPGHGPKNGLYSGASRTWNGVTYYEDVINYKIAGYLKAELETYPNVKVYLTRDENSCPGLSERVQYAAGLGADMLVSCHCNSSTKSDPNGLMAMVARVGSYNPENAQKGQNIANAILNQLMTLGFNKNYGFYMPLDDGSTDNDPSYYPDGSVADYYSICKYGQLYNVPSFIIEHGFVSNQEECERVFGSESMIQALGKADATAIANYLGLSRDNGISKSGWQTDAEGHISYYINDVKQTGTVVIDGKKYWFDGNGYLQTGWLNLAGMVLYFDPDDSGAAAVGERTVDGTGYLFDDNGVMLNGSGLTEYNGSFYYMDGNTLKSGWVTLADGSRMYFDADNGYAAATGTVLIGGKKYWFDGNGIQQTGKLVWSGMTLYFDPNDGGAAIIGVGMMDGRRCLFDSNGVLQTGTGTPIINGKKYYLLNGEVQVGFANIAPAYGWILYLDPENGYAAATGTVLIGRKYYEFDSNGILIGAKTGMFVANGRKYLTDSSGELISGWVDLTSAWRLYFDPENGYAAATGFYNINGNLYYFDENGVMAQDGTPVINGKKYIIRNNGKIAAGWVNLTDSWIFYCNPSDNGAVLTGWQSVNGKTYYFDANGLAQLGFVTIDNARYYIDREAGMYASATPVIDGKKYAFDADGKQLYGWYELGSWKMYFDPDSNGAAVTTYIELDGVIYQFNSDGILTASNVSSVKAVDPASGRTYTLEGTFVTDPQVGADITEDEFFAAAVYAEAGSQGLAGQTAVAMVMLNRVNSSSYADTLTYVIYQKTHFEVARNGALTKYLIAFRDNDESILKYIRNAQTMEAVAAAKQIMKNYKENGTPRQIDGISSEYGVKDFGCLYFVTPAAFERQNLDPEACETFQYKNLIFFNKWIKKS